MKKPEFKKEYNFIRREFLNKDFYHSSANIVGKLVLDDYNWLDSNLKISNCERTLNIEVDCETEEDIENSIYKLSQIISVCEDYKTALVKLRPYIRDKRAFEKWEEEQKEKKKDE